MYNDSDTVGAYCCSLNSLRQVFLSWVEGVILGRGECTESLLRPSFGVFGLRVVSIVSWWGAARAGLEVPHMVLAFHWSEPGHVAMLNYKAGWEM